MYPLDNVIRSLNNRGQEERTQGTRLEGSYSTECLRFAAAMYGAYLTALLINWTEKEEKLMLHCIVIYRCY